jgi:hypothetical protein
LMREWKVYKEPEHQEFIPGQYPNPGENSTLQAISWKGFAVAAMLALFNKSSEKSVKTVIKTEVSGKSSMKVVALEDFSPGKLQLVGLTSNVGMASHDQVKKQSKSTIDLGVAYEDAKDGNIHITAQHYTLTFPKPTQHADVRQARQHIIAQYWAVQAGNHNSQKVNMEKQMREVSSKVANESHSLEIPVMVNVVKIKAGTELVFLKVDPPEPEEPPAKRSKLDESKGKGKGKSKKK